MAGAAVLSAWGMYKSVQKVQEQTAELKRPLTKKEKFKYCWPYFIPAGTMLFASGGCIIGASVKSAKLNAQLATDFAASQASLALLKEKTVETVGEAKAAAIQQKVIEDKMIRAQQPLPEQSNLVVVSGGAKTWFFDVPSERYYRSTVNNVDRAFIDTSNQVGDDMYATWNTLIDNINSPDLPRLPGAGLNLGFVAHGTKYKIDYTKTAIMLPDGSDSCIAVDYAVEPLDYNKIMHGDGS
jgi:hypothetical protein